jgi:prophage regulatory protein
MRNTNNTIIKQDLYKLANEINIEFQSDDIKVRKMVTASPILLTINSLLRCPLVQHATGDSRSTIYRKIQNGLFTRPVNRGGSSVAWPASEVDAINRARIAGKSDSDIRILVVELELARIA